MRIARTVDQSGWLLASGAGCIRGPGHWSRSPSDPPESRLLLLLLLLGAVICLNAMRQAGLETQQLRPAE